MFHACLAQDRQDSSSGTPVSEKVVQPFFQACLEDQGLVLLNHSVPSFKSTVHPRTEVATGVTGTSYIHTPDYMRFAPRLPPPATLAHKE